MFLIKPLLKYIYHEELWLNEWINEDADNDYSLLPCSSYL